MGFTFFLIIVVFGAIAVIGLIASVFNDIFATTEPFLVFLLGGGAGTVFGIYLALRFGEKDEERWAPPESETLEQKIHREWGSDSEDF